MPTDALATATSAQRFSAIDALRGMAMVWMTAFHFCFDLNYFGYLATDFHRNPWWLVQRACIVTLFVFCAGLGQAVAVAQGQSWRRFGKRWLQIAGCALLVSVGSYQLYPQTFIYFGILHGMALMLLVVRCTAAWGRWLWPLGALALLMPQWALYAHSLAPALEGLNAPSLNWLGLVSHKPVTEDYAPLFPWLGVMWWGMASGQWVLRLYPHVLQRVSCAITTGAWGRLGKPLALLGAWSLCYYMLHQPVLLGALALFSWLR